MDDRRNTDHPPETSPLNPKDSLTTLCDRNSREKLFNPAGDLVTLNRDCCVKTILASVLLATAFVLIVIAASSRDGGLDDHSQLVSSIQEADVRWDVNHLGHPRLLLRHQFLVRQIRGGDFAQRMALHEQSQVYVIEILDQRIKFFKQYIVINFEKGTETFLLVSRELNEVSSEFLERTVLLCHSQKMPRWRQRLYVSASVLGTSSAFQCALGDDVVDMEHVYVGDWLAAPPFLSTVVNGTCSALPKPAIFDWGHVDESQACGSNITMATKPKSCPSNVCSPLTNIPLSRVTTCHKFRRCNFLLELCDHSSFSLSRHNFNFKMEAVKLPYCACRRAAAADAIHLSCPLPKYDGGECEFPRRDLYSSQYTLPCQCHYTFPIVYPFLRSGKSIRDRQQQDFMFVRENENKVNWRAQLENKTGPARNFRMCVC